MDRETSFRDDFQSMLGGPKERRKIMREIRMLEMEELRRLHSINTENEEQDQNEDLDGTYLTQPAPLQGLEGAGRRASSQAEVLYGRPLSAYSRGSSPHLVMTAMAEELDPAKQHERLLFQQSHAANLSVPRIPPTKHFINFMKAPSAMRKRGLRSPDVLFEPGVDDKGIFWLYGKHRVSQSTLGSAAGSMASATFRGAPQIMDESTFKKLPVWANIKRKLTNMIAQGAQQERFGIVFDIVSTGKILTKGIPHMAGRLIYEFIEDCRHEAGVNKLKFIFVGITDNINCCTARDVFCLDDRVGGVYVGDFKRPFTALDNVHMFAVLPPTTSRFYDQLLHSREPGYQMLSQRSDTPNDSKADRDGRPPLATKKDSSGELPPLPPQRSATPASK